MSYDERLRQAVRDHKVCWEVLPHTAFVDGDTRQVGFDLELTGTPLAGGEQTPTSENCQKVYSVLRAIAHRTIPKNPTPSICEISPFDDCIRYSPTHEDRPDVILTITIGHQYGFNEVDESELRCLEEMKTKLGDLGAQCGTWNQELNQTA